MSPKSNGEPAQARTGTSEDISPGDDRGFYSQKEIEDKWDPPVFTERVAFRANDNTGEFLQWGFHNDGSDQLSGNQLHLFFVGRGYKVQPVTDREMQRLMLTEALQRRENPAIDTILHQVGGVSEYTLGTLEPDEWNDIQSEMSQVFNVEELTATPSDLLATAG